MSILSTVDKEYISLAKYGWCAMGISRSYSTPKELVLALNRRLTTQLGVVAGTSTIYKFIQEICTEKYVTKVELHHMPAAIRVASRPMITMPHFYIVKVFGDSLVNGMSCALIAPHIQDDCPQVKIIENCLFDVRYLPDYQEVTDDTMIDLTGTDRSLVEPGVIEKPYVWTPLHNQDEYIE